MNGRSEITDTVHDMCDRGYSDVHPHSTTSGGLAGRWSVEVVRQGRMPSQLAETMKLALVVIYLLSKITQTLYDLSLRILKSATFGNMNIKLPLLQKHLGDTE